MILTTSRLESTEQAQNSDMELLSGYDSLIFIKSVLDNALLEYGELPCLLPFTVYLELEHLAEYKFLFTTLDLTLRDLGLGLGLACQDSMLPLVFLWYMQQEKQIRQHRNAFLSQP
mgnify:CR=1 FL=1